VREDANASHPADGARLEGDGSGVGGGLVEMPQCPAILLGRGTLGEVLVDVLEGRFDSIQQIAEPFEGYPRDEDVILTEMMSFSGQSRFVRALTVRTSAIASRPARSAGNQEACPAPPATSCGSR
jgi:hypothetical protein